MSERDFLLRSDEPIWINNRRVPEGVFTGYSIFKGQVIFKRVDLKEQTYDPSKNTLQKVYKPCLSNIYEDKLPNSQDFPELAYRPDLKNFEVVHLKRRQIKSAFYFDFLDLDADDAFDVPPDFYDGSDCIRTVTGQDLVEQNFSYLGVLSTTANPLYYLYELQHIKSLISSPHNSKLTVYSTGNSKVSTPRGLRFNVNNIASLDLYRSKTAVG